MDQRVLSPPHGLSQSATSFIASYRQGIHQTPFSRLIRASERMTFASHSDAKRRLRSTTALRLRGSTLRMQRAEAIAGPNRHIHTFLVSSSQRPPRQKVPLGQCMHTLQAQGMLLDLERLCSFCMDLAPDQDWYPELLLKRSHAGPPSHGSAVNTSRVSLSSRFQELSSETRKRNTSTPGADVYCVSTFLLQERARACDPFGEAGVLCRRQNWWRIAGSNR